MNETFIKWGVKHKSVKSRFEDQCQRYNLCPRVFSRELEPIYSVEALLEEKVLTCVRHKGVLWFTLILIAFCSLATSVG